VSSRLPLVFRNNILLSRSFPAARRRRRFPDHALIAMGNMQIA